MLGWWTEERGANLWVNFKTHFQFQEDTGTVVFCNNEAVGVITLVGEECLKSKHVHPFVATSIPQFRGWILRNDGERVKPGFVFILFPIFFTLKGV